MMDYYNFRRFSKTGLVNPRPTSTTLSYNTYSPFDNLKIPIELDPDTSRFDMVTPSCINTIKIISVTPKDKFYCHG